MTTLSNAAAKSAMLVLVLCAVFWSAPKTADPLQNSAVSDSRLAVKRYLERTAEYPKAVDAWMKLSGAYLALAAETGDPGLIAPADSAVSVALSLAPIDVEALNQLSRVRSAQHRYEEILSIEHESIYYDVANADSWGLAGDAYMDLGRYRSADSCYYKMYEINPGLKSQMRMARRMFDLGDFDVAVRHIEAAIDTARAGGESEYQILADAQVRLGRMFLSRGDWDTAMSRTDTSLAVVPGYGPALELKAEIYYFQRAFVESRTIYEQLARSSADPAFLSGEARGLAGEGDTQRADSLLHAAASAYKQRYSKYPDITRRDYVGFLLDWGINLELAQQLAYEESRHRRDVYTYDLLAWAYFKNKNYNLAWSAIALALRNEAKHPKIMYHAAVIAKAAGKKDKYKTYAAKIRTLNPRFEAMYGSF